MGSKLALLGDIETMINAHASGYERSFLDLFAGSNAVGQYFKKDYQIYSNDVLYFSYVLARATLENNTPLLFEHLKKNGIAHPLDYLQHTALPSEGTDYYEVNYSPGGAAGRMYFSAANARRIDFIRDQLDKWKRAGLIHDAEFYYLLAALLEAVPLVSNTTGTYGAYLKTWDRRALKPLALKPLQVLDNGRANRAFHGDANALVREIKADIVYIDTPYNVRQYASNYHVLENIARNEKPELRGITGMWHDSRLRSDYSLKNRALEAMDDLIRNVRATHVVVSYNNEGIIPEHDLIALLKHYAVKGHYDIKRIPHQKYKAKIGSKKHHLYELLIYIQRSEAGAKTFAAAGGAAARTWHADRAYIKSPLNYIGGKYKLLRQIVPLFPDSIRVFVDLFSGGANVGINVPAKKHIFNDMNDKVNEMFRYFSAQEPDVLIARVNRLIAENGLSKTNEAAYLAFRKKYNQHPNPLDLYILASYSYNYQIRFNNAMQFNNAFGRDRSQFSRNMAENLYRFVARLRTIDAVFVDGYFDALDLSALGTDDFVYLDPPYLMTTGNYNDGNRGFLNWDIEQEKIMYGVMDCLTKNKVRWALSNVLESKGCANELLKDYIEKRHLHVTYLTVRDNNASYNTTVSGSKEVLVTNYNPATKNMPLLREAGRLL